MMNSKCLTFIVWCVSLGFSGGVATAEELRTLQGRWIKIVTDLPSSPATDSLPQSVDAAVPQWIRFWKQPANCVDGWQLTLYLIEDLPRFRQAGLIPRNLPDFPHGFQSGKEAWAIVQPSDYFTRHLVLHESFHGFAEHVFGGTGPSWFAEGTAEMMATHTGSAGTIRVPIIPASREAAPYWGRFKIINQRRDEHVVPAIETILGQRNALYAEVEPYVWSWSAAVLMTMYPEYRSALTAASKRVVDRSSNFALAFRGDLESEWPALRTRWQLLMEDFDYGYDIARNRADWKMPDLDWTGSIRSMKIAANRGWHSAGVKIPAGAEIQVKATGRYSLGNQPRPWICEPPGVTVRYHRGHPLGMVLAALVPIADGENGVVRPLQVERVGSRASIVAKQDSWLYFRIGDDPSELADNQGEATVQFVRQIP